MCWMETVYFMDDELPIPSMKKSCRSMATTGLEGLAREKHSEATENVKSACPRPRRSNKRPCRPSPAYEEAHSPRPWLPTRDGLASPQDLFAPRTDGAVGGIRRGSR